MNVLHIAGLRGYGGIHTFIEELSGYQALAQKMEVGILSLLMGEGDQVARMRENVLVHQGGLKSGYEVNLRKYYRIFRLFKQYDILHFHGFNPMAAVCAILSGKNIVYTEHGTFQRANLKINFRNFFKKRILGFTFLEYATSTVVFISEWLKQDLNLKRANCVVIYNGTEAKGEGERKSTGDGMFRILSVGRLVVRKRVDRLIRGHSLVEDRQDTVLQIVGDGPLLKELSDYAASVLEAGCYRFYGYRSDVANFYENADLFVLPTEFEPFGLVVVEAMLCEIPVICFRDGGGAVEIVAGIHKQLIVQDEAELAHAIMYWKERRQERTWVGKKLRERAQKLFTVERMAEDYMQLYETLLAANTGQGNEKVVQNRV